MGITTHYARCTLRTPRTILGALTILFGAASARAEDPPPPRAVRLEYTRGPGAERCPTPKTMQDAVVLNMSFDPFAAEAPARLVVTIVRKGPMFQGTAEIRDADGAVLWSYPLADGDCHLVVDGIGFATGVK